MSLVAPEGGGPDTVVAYRIAARVIDDVGPAAPASRLSGGLAAALRAEHVAGDRRSRARRAREIALLWQLLGTGSPPAVTGLARHVAFVLARPRGNPLWEDLRRLTSLLDDLGRTLRAQRRRARLRPGSSPAGAAARGTEQVMATALRGFAETWRSPPGPTAPPADPARPRPPPVPPIGGPGQPFGGA